MRGWLATVPAQEANVTPRDDHGNSGGDTHRASSRSREALMDSVSYLNPAQLHSSPSFSKPSASRAGHDVIVIGGQKAQPHEPQ
jgi:hypothetical protein